MSVKTARKAVEEISRLKKARAFEVAGQEHLVEEAHKKGLKLLVYIRPADNTETLREALLKLKVDRLMY